MSKKKYIAREEAIQILKSQVNVRVSHDLFDEEEYLYMKDGKVYDENGYLFDDWYSPHHNGVRERVGGAWETGWYVKPSPCRYKKIEYNETVDNKTVPMVAVYDSEWFDDMHAIRMLRSKEESPYMMKMCKTHYDNLLAPALKEAKKAT
jgi:hypothetical protein